MPPRKTPPKKKVNLLALLKTEGPAPVYAVDGVHLLVDEFVRAVQAAAFPPGAPGADFNVETFVGQRTTLFRVLEAARTLPAFAPRRLVVVRQAEPLLKLSADEPAMVDFLRYLTSPSSTTTLVLAAEDKFDRRAKVYKALEKAGQAVRFEPPSEREMPRVIHERAQAAGIRIEPEAIRALVSATGSDLGAAVSALERLDLYVGPGSEQPIRAEDVHELVTRVREDSVFELVDAVAEGNTAAVLTGVHRMLTVQGEHPFRVLALVARQYRNLVRARAALDVNASERSLASLLGIPPFAVDTIVDQARAGDTARFARSLASIASTDMANKGGVVDGVRSMERLALALRRDERLDPPESRSGATR